MAEKKKVFRVMGRARHACFLRDKDLRKGSGAKVAGKEKAFRVMERARRAGMDGKNETRAAE